MAIVIDSDVLIARERGVFNLESWLAERPSEKFELAAITIAELFHGLERASGSRWKIRKTFIDSVLEALEVIPYTRETAQIHARLWADHESRGKMIDYHDLIVAATAIERDASVATFNKRHFSAVKGLKVIQPS